MANSTIKVTLKRSHIGQKPKLRKTLTALGLKRPNTSVMLPDTDDVRAMIRHVAHLVDVEDGG